MGRAASHTKGGTMGRPKLNDEDVRKKWISVRVSEQEYQYISESANKLKISSAQLLREKGMNLKIRKVNSGINIKAYRQICGIAKNINQLVAKVNSGVIENVDISHIAYLKRQIDEIAKMVLK